MFIIFLTSFRTNNDGECRLKKCVTFEIFRSVHYPLEWFFYFTDEKRLKETFSHRSSHSFWTEWSRITYIRCGFVFFFTFSDHHDQCLTFKKISPEGTFLRHLHYEIVGEWRYIMKKYINLFSYITWKVRLNKGGYNIFDRTSSRVFTFSSLGAWAHGLRG